MTTYTLHNAKKNRGFTLIELLVVIGILAILLSITLIAINPSARFGQANDTKRRSDVTQVLNAIGQYTATNTGQLPSEISGLTVDTDYLLSDGTTELQTLCAKLVPDYMAALPADPTLNNQAGVSDCATAGWNTGYSISRDANGRVTVSAPSAVSGTIEVTR